MKTPPCSPMSTGSFGDVSIPSKIRKISDPGERLHHLLSTSIETEDTLLWAKILKLCDMNPEAANYCDPDTLDTPLHLACRVLRVLETSPVNRDGITATPADAIRMLIRCYADNVSSKNKKGYIPLHYAFPNSSKSEADTYVHHQVQVINILIAADYDASIEYLSRNDVVFNEEDGACTPLYHAVSSVRDDFSNPPGPTVDLISAIHFPNPKMVCAKNSSNHDKPLALLYRRFSRQFDLSEKFFPGDNSRKAVLEHRQRYKTSAMNTWKIILKLLDPLSDKKKSVCDFYIVHSAVKMDCPPDLIRYIIETRQGEVSKTDENGRLPLHIAAAVNRTDTRSSYHFKYVIDELLYAFPDGAAFADKDGKLPLQLAIESGKSWIGGGIKSLFNVYPDAMENVTLSDYPTIKKALSFSSNFVEEQEAEEINNTENKLVKEEHYDAIMMVQKPDADLGNVVSAMWANEEDGGVQMLGCVAINELAKKNANDKRKLFAIALSAVTTIVNAMKNHPNEPAVQEKACGALKALAPADNHREVSFAASGAAASIVAAMQAHVSDAIVQQEACSALREIVEYGGADRATVIASVSGFTALQNALGAHPDSVGVQYEACLTLDTLTAFPDANLPDLPGVQTAPLLEAAAHRFPQECKVTAAIVISRLS